MLFREEDEDLDVLPFANRGEAGRMLASRLAAYSGRRKSSYRGSRPPLELNGKTVILVDDGIATGCSILAAIAAIRRENATRVVVAVPVAPASGCSAIRMEADEVISVEEPEMFLAVSQWYRDFKQVSDEDVQRLLASGRSMSRAA